MHSRKGRTSNSGIEHLRGEALRKITASDKFPCFGCYDHHKDKLDCKECNGNGWISGTHPMVQFAQDFIEKRLGGLLQTQTGTSWAPSSDFGEANPRMSGSEQPYKKPKEIFASSSARTVSLGDSLRHSVRKETTQQFCPQQYFCDECITKDPIKGKCYHCKVCEDYDLCDSCYQSGVHAEHEMEEILPFKRPDNETLVAENKKGHLVKKSMKLNSK